MQSYDIKDIIMLQPVINVGMIGHVANGKSTIVKCLTSKATQQFSSEKERNITIHLGYANAKIWRCAKCSEPECYSSSDSSVMKSTCQHCSSQTELVSHISFVDCPGHNELTSTMLNGSSVMDYTVLVEAGDNDSIPAAQTAEHLVATKNASIPTCMVVMNKIDLINRQKAQLQAEKISDYVSKITGSMPPVVPVSATFGINADVICQQLSLLKPPTPNIDDRFKMLVIRSFDINKPGIDVRKIHGGVIGGTITRGVLRTGDTIRIYPGMVKSISNEKRTPKTPDFLYQPIVAKVLSMKSDMNSLDIAVPGGLLGIQLTIDPAFTKGDHMSGSLVVKEDDVNHGDRMTVSVYDKIIVDVRKIVQESEDVARFFKSKPALIINFNSNNINCTTYKYIHDEKLLGLFLNHPIAVESTDNYVTIMKKTGSHGKDIIGRGVIVDGLHCTLMH